MGGAFSANGQACSSLVIQTDTDNYTIGEPVKITVTFSPLLPGCVEPMIAHDYVIQILVLSALNQTVYSSTNATAGTLTLHETWTPTTTGDYLIQASSWFRLLGNDFMTKEMEASTTIHVHDPVESTMLTLELGVIGLIGTFAVTIGIVFLMRVRKKPSSRITPPGHETSALLSRWLATSLTREATCEA
jgi:hypothetical protein